MQIEDKNKIMLNWLSTYKNILEACRVNYMPPATEQEINDLEAYLQVPLPPSFKEFLRISNGIKEYHIYGTIFSIEQIKKSVKKWSFSPWTGQLEAVDPNNELGHFYSYRPKHFLLFSSFYPGGDGYCMNTNPEGGEEYKIYHYDIEFVEVDQLEEFIKQVKFVSFEEMLSQPLLEIYSYAVQRGEIKADRQIRKAFEKISGQKIDAPITKFLSKNPSDYKHSLWLGKYYFGIEEYELARNCFQYALDAKPDYEEAKIHLEDTLSKLL